MLELLPKVSLGAAGVLAPLTDTLRGPGKFLTRSPALDSAFRHTKDLLISVPELVHPHPGAQISLAVDPSNSNVGSVLQQLLDGSLMAPGLLWLSPSRRYLLQNRNTPPLRGAAHCLLFSLAFPFPLKR